MSVIERERIEAPSRPTERALPPLVTKPEILHRAAEIIEERGWGHGSESMVVPSYLRQARGLRMEGPVCLLGALEAAWIDCGYESRSGYLLGDELLGPGGSIAYSWNDALPRGGFRNRHSKRSQAKVVARLREAASA